MMIFIKHSEDESRMGLSRHVANMGQWKMHTKIRCKDVMGRDYLMISYRILLYLRSRKIVSVIFEQ